MIRLPIGNSYSSEVRLTLSVGERLFEVRQSGPDRCLLQEPENCDPGPAELRMSIDGRIQTRSVYLRDGIRSGQQEVFFA